MRSPRAPILASLLVLAACEAEPLEPGSAAPEVLAADVAANPRNVLSAVVTAEVGSADSVAVRYEVAGGPVAGVTPAISAAEGPLVLPVLGLLPGTEHSLTVVAYGDGITVEGDPLPFTSGPLPDDLPTFVAGGPDPSPGYVVFSAGSYGLVIDNTGRVVWYHRFDGPAGLNFQAQPNGRYATLPPTGTAAPPGVWMEIDPLGTVTRTLGCADGLAPRFHDLLVEVDGSYWMLCDETRMMDLSADGGVIDARVIGTGVQHVSASGAVVFRWSPFDHFEITDLEAAQRTGAVVNWTHGNALDLDPEGNLLVSFRSLGELTSIDTGTGEVRWRMGGLRNQFDFQGGPEPAFAWQHGVRSTGSGSLLLLDNRGDPAASRAERYEFDAGARTAQRIRAYASQPSVLALLGGTTQPLPGGRALVSYGNGGRVEEYDAAGHVVWSIQAPGYVFRAQRITSLYAPGVGMPR